MHAVYCMSCLALAPQLSRQLAAAVAGALHCRVARVRAGHTACFASMCFCLCSAAKMSLQQGRKLDMFPCARDPHSHCQEARSWKCSGFLRQQLGSDLAVPLARPRGPRLVGVDEPHARLHTCISGFARMMHHAESSSHAADMPGMRSTPCADMHSFRPHVSPCRPLGTCRRVAASHLEHTHMVA